MAFFSQACTANDRGWMEVLQKSRVQKIWKETVKARRMPTGTKKKLGTGSTSCSVGCIAWMEVPPCLWDMPKSEEDSWTGAAVWLLLLRRARVNFSGTSSCFEILAPCNACMLLWRFLCVWFEQRTSGGGPGWSRLNSDSEVAIITPVESRVDRHCNLHLH